MTVSPLAVLELAAWCRWPYWLGQWWWRWRFQAVGV